MEDDIRERISALERTILSQGELIKLLVKERKINSETMQVVQGELIALKAKSEVLAESITELRSSRST